MKNKNIYILRKQCVLCDSKKLKKAFFLKKTPLANSYLKKIHNKEIFISLTVYLCSYCGHLQLREIINPEVLFKNYSYVSGTSNVLRLHFWNYCEKVIKKYKLKKNDNILDIACNDGTFLENFVKKKFKNVVGIEPAKNLRKINIKKNIRIETNFFSNSFSQKLKKKYKAFRLITANNVCAHTPHLLDFFNGVKNLLAPNGIFVFEVSYLLDVINKLQFDTVYHEHMSYHSLKPLVNFFNTINLEIIDFERVKAQGGSIRIYVSHVGTFKKRNQKINNQIKIENKNKLFNLITYKRFISKILHQKKILRKKINKFKKNKLKIIGYGAPAKLTTFCHYLDINKNDIDYIIDDNKLKQNTYSPGKKIPIKNINFLKTNIPDVIVVLAWNFFDSIVLKCKKIIKKKIIYLKSFPKIKIVN